MRHDVKLIVAMAALVLMLATQIGPSVRAEENSSVPALTAALAGPQRSAKFTARDRFRHPAETLLFFGLRPRMSVIEIWPGGGYWTEILAPVLRADGHYRIALPPSENASTLPMSAIGRKLADVPTVYDKAVIGIFGKDHLDLATADSADLVVSFRNLHNWMAGDYAPAMFAAIFKSLKKGGVFGLEEHRGQRAGAQDPRAADGYVQEAAVIAFAKEAGFVLDATSEVNANPRDTADWPRGVWTLPPDLALGDTDRAKYLAIGEADNAVYKFRKP